MSALAVTGAAGSLGRDIVPVLRDAGYDIVGIDRQGPPDGFVGQWQQCDLAHEMPDLRGTQAVVHLAGIPLESDWASLRAANIDATQTVLHAAHRDGVPRVVLASSIHAVGFTPVPEPGELLADDIPDRPNTFYGVTKVAMEALGRLYHDRYGLDVVCLRIASRFETPRDERMRHTWLSPADAARLFRAAVTVPSPGFQIVWGVSANSESWFSTAGAREISYVPCDDAEQASCSVPTSASNRPWDRTIGGAFSSPTPPSMTDPAGFGHDSIAKGGS